VGLGIKFLILRVGGGARAGRQSDFGATRGRKFFVAVNGEMEWLTTAVVLGQTR
jgi:hypothetical protein